jgi:hypothetical protein
MVIGVDFDNTIACYDRLFYQLALERDLIPASLPADKESVRDCLRLAGREEDWTELQGFAYGPRIPEAFPFPGVQEFFQLCRERAIPVCIISHKTRLPVRGPQVDLHQAARRWLQRRGFHDPARIGLPPERVFFEETKQAKLQRVSDQQCTHFIDDLPEFLQAPEFPGGIERILFDPWERRAAGVPCLRVSNWEQLTERLLVTT